MLSRHWPVTPVSVKPAAVIHPGTDDWLVNMMNRSALAVMSKAKLVSLVESLWRFVAIQLAPAAAAGTTSNELSPVPS